MEARRPRSRGAATHRASGPDESRSEGRRCDLDNLKVLLIAGVIFVHGVIGYVDADLWPYGNVQEVELSSVGLAAFMVFAGPFGLFMMALLFLVAGLLTPGSLQRKGVAVFVRDRMLRLGVPFVVFTLLLWPMATYTLYRSFGWVHQPYLAEFRDSYPDQGPLWFVGTLLLFSLGYAGWFAVRAGRDRPDPARSLTTRRLVALVPLIAVASFVIRLAWPYGSQSLLDLNEWQWPECLALFAVGVVGAREGWIGGVPDQLGRQARALALWSVGLTAAFLASTPLLSVDGDELLGGWTWPALVLALLGAMLTVFGSVWLLSLAQRHLDREIPHGRELARSSYAAFILGAFVDLGVAVAMRPIPATGEIKALVVGVVAVVCSFALAWLIVVRLRLFPRVL